jgi:hypothetical protein
MRFRSKVNGLALFAATLFVASQAQAFCGFYVGKADASLFNEASQVIMARDGNRTVISMLNDYKGSLTEFALVVPVPTVLQREQVNVGERVMFDRLDAYSAPRLAEYHDEDPCAPRRQYEMSMAPRGAAALAPAPTMRAKSDLGVSVEASYTVGEYDIVMLSATQSDGLETWLTSNGYRIPAGASKALGPYIKQGMKFFVAKVNLKEQAKTGVQTLRPIQFAFDSEKFMLPLRLGMINANGPQDLIVYMLTRNGRVESSNYRTVPLPANMDLPVFVRSDFKSFYKAMFDRQAAKEDYKVVFTEYFWDMAWCDPCAANPLSSTELRKAGAFWVDSKEQNRRFNQGAQPALLTRLHVRYTKETFPEDLMFQQTNDKQNFQTRYVLRHAFAGSPTACAVAKQYYDGVAKRQEKEAQQLASLTGWSMASVREKMPYMQQASNQSINPSSQGWWKDLWVQ